MDNTQPTNPNPAPTTPNPAPNPEAPWLKPEQSAQTPAPKPSIPDAQTPAPQAVPPKTFVAYIPTTTSAPTPTPAPAAVSAPTMNVPPKPASPLPKPVEAPAKPPTTQSTGPLQAPRWRVWLWRVLVVLALLAAGGLAFLLIWPSIQSQFNKPATTATSTATSAQEVGTETPATGTVTTPPVETTTTTIQTPVATTTEEKAPFQQVTSTVHYLGDAPAFFLNDEVILKDRNNPKRSYSVMAVEFTDSRCPKDVVCVWQGEQGVRLRIKDMGTGQTEYVSLGMVRAKTASAMGLKFDLLEIEDGKGGVYAKIRVM